MLPVGSTIANNQATKVDLLSNCFSGVQQLQLLVVEVHLISQCWRVDTTIADSREIETVALEIIKIREELLQEL